MQQLTSPRWRSKWDNLSASQWTTIRNLFTSNIYPSGVVTTGVDSVIYNYTGQTLPENCSHMSQYTITNPGGRVCLQPQHQYLCYPIVQPLGICLVFMCGHLPVTGEYLATDGSSPIVVGLSKGWHVLVIPMPSFDWNQAASTQNIVVGGVLTPLFEHNYPSLDTDGGPTSSRMFTDQVIRASNQVMAEISPSKWILSGHSGGGCTCPWIGIIDSRYLGVYDFEGGLSIALGAQPGASSDYEQFLANPVYKNSPYCYDVWGTFQLSAALSGRRSGFASAFDDIYFPVPISNTGLWNEQIEAMNNFVEPANASIGGYLENAGAGHDMTPERVTWMFNDIQQYLGF